MSFFLLLFLPTLPEVWYCHLPFFPHVHFAPEPETGRTRTDEVGRSKTTFPTLSFEASAQERCGERVMLLLMLFSVVSSTLFLSALPSSLLSVLALPSPPSGVMGAMVRGVQLREAHSPGM